MEEILYNIEIHKGEGNYMGKIYSDIDGVKEFKNERIYDLPIVLQIVSNRKKE